MASPSSFTAWMGDLPVEASPSSTVKNVSLDSGSFTAGTGDDSSSWFGDLLSGIGSVLTYPFQWVQTQVSSAENTVLLALVVLAVLIIAVVALIGFAPNVKHLLPHFV